MTIVNYLNQVPAGNGSSWLLGALKAKLKAHGWLVKMSGNSTGAYSDTGDVSPDDSYFQDWCVFTPPDESIYIYYGAGIGGGTGDWLKVKASFNPFTGGAYNVEPTSVAERIMLGGTGTNSYDVFTSPTAADTRYHMSILTTPPYGFCFWAIKVSTGEVQGAAIIEGITRTGISEGGPTYNFCFNRTTALVADMQLTYTLWGSSVVYGSFVTLVSGNDYDFSGYNVSQGRYSYALTKYWTNSAGTVLVDKALANDADGDTILLPKYYAGVTDASEPSPSGIDGFSQFFKTVGGNLANGTRLKTPSDGTFIIYNGMGFPWEDGVAAAGLTDAQVNAKAIAPSYFMVPMETMMGVSVGAAFYYKMYGLTDPGGIPIIWIATEPDWLGTQAPEAVQTATIRQLATYGGG